jgi:hypothetical protein
MSQKTKELGRQHVMTTPRSPEEWEQLVAYNIGDVRDLRTLFIAMREKGVIVPDRALLHGRYLKAAAVIERTGIPFDVETYDRIMRRRVEIAQRLVRAVDPRGDVFAGTSLSPNQFAAYLHRLDIPWPRTRTGKLALDAETFSDQAKLHPNELRAIAEVQKHLPSSDRTGCVKPSGPTAGGEPRSGRSRQSRGATSHPEDSRSSSRRSGPAH